jgi:hypothetical protein
MKSATLRLTESMIAAQDGLKQVWAAKDQVIAALLEERDALRAELAAALAAQPGEARRGRPVERTRR